MGVAERNLKMIREALGVKVLVRPDELTVVGQPRAVAATRSVISRLADAARGGRSLQRSDVLGLIAEAAAREAQAPRGAQSRADGRISWTGDLSAYVAGRRLEPRSENQRRYIDAIRQNDMVFAIGPAGTGKTYLAVAAAVHMLRQELIRKIMLVRPAVEAGERLGFLPGGLEEKVNPYLRPLLDALHDMMDFGTIQRFLDSDVLEIAPLAFMRGRTLNHSVIILDEAQNTTRSQMQMFLTRLGEGSKMIITGDITQIDLPDPTQSGLIDASRRLRRVKGIGFVTLEREDVVRHKLVQRVVDAYGEQRDHNGAAENKA